MNDLLLSSQPLGPTQRYPAWVGIIVVVVVFLLPIMYSFIKRKKSAKWESGIFPPDFPFNRDNLMEAYISVAAVMVGKDPHKMAGKLVFINAYFEREFRDVYYDFSDSYRFSLRNPVSIKSMAFWFNRHLRSDAEKMHIVWFLYDLCWYDGELNDREYAALKAFTLGLNQPWEPVEARIQERDRSETKATVSLSDKRKRSLAVLGLDEPSDQELIRITYRKLVKIYHPDKFMQESKEVRDRGTAKFREIQEAYEYLSDNE